MNKSEIRKKRNSDKKLKKFLKMASVGIIVLAVIAGMHIGYHFAMYTASPFIKDGEIYIKFGEQVHVYK